MALIWTAVRCRGWPAAQAWTVFALAGLLRFVRLVEWFCRSFGKLCRGGTLACRRLWRAIDCRWFLDCGKSHRLFLVIQSFPQRLRLYHQRGFGLAA